MESTGVLIVTIVSFTSLLGLLIGGVVTWVKFSSMAEQNRKILCGYKNKNGSPIFRTEEECAVLHQDTIDKSFKKIEEVKLEIKENIELMTGMFLEIKEFMGSTTTAIINLEKTQEKKDG